MMIRIYPLSRSGAVWPTVSVRFAASSTPRGVPLRRVGSCLRRAISSPRSVLIKISATRHQHRRQQRRTSRFHKFVSFVVCMRLSRAAGFRLKDVDEILRIATYGYRSGLGTAVGGAPCARFLCQPRKNPKSKVFLHHRNQHTHTYCTVQITHTQIIFVSDSTKNVLPPPEPYDSSRASRHKIAHFLPLFLAACGGTSTTRMASSKTFFSLGRRGLGLE